MNKKITTLSLILVLTITSLIGGISIANAQMEKKTFVFIGLIPDQVGVGQEVLIHLGIWVPPENIYWGWEGLTVTVTKPDGTTQTLGPYTTDATGGTGAPFVPTQVGTYTLQSHFPQQTVPEDFEAAESGIFYPAGTVMLASNSEVVELIVTEDPIDYYPANPLPTEFWSRPIDSNFREWSVIGGNWLERTKNQNAPYNDAPETAHILWAKPYTFGGVAGGETGEHAFEDGDAYEGKFQGSVIIGGVLYYNRFTSPGRGSPPAQGIVAVDLRTGEDLWFRNNSRLAFGQTYYWDNFNYHGVYSFIWETSGSTWDAYDAYSGEWIYGMTDVPSGVRFTGDDGDFYILEYDLDAGWIALWSQRDAAKWINVGGGSAEGSWGRYVHGKVFNASLPGAYVWNHTIPAGIPSTNLGARLGRNQVIDDRFLLLSTNADRTELRAVAIGIGENNAGQVLFDKIWNTPSEWSEGMLTIHYTSHTDYGPGGVYIVWAKELYKHYGFSLDNGAFLWESEPEHYLQAYGWTYLEHSWHIVYDKLYSTGVSGILYCYDIFTGERLWTYESEDPYSEYLFGNNFWNWISFISDGKIYMAHTEHSAIDPKPRGAPFVCLDAETGEVIWRTEGMFRSTRWGGQGIIGDSIMALMDTYDLRIYAVGKGPSQTTVEAPKAGIPEGSSVVICGSVTDISAGTASPELAARFPNGVAAVADESMSDWMEYVYKQFPFPVPHVFGVDVSIDVIDVNGNFRNIGTAQTDANGFYSLAWTPDIYGPYTVIATFPGSGGYYASYDEAAFVVDAAPDPTPAPPDPTPAPPTETYIAGSTIAIIAAIAVVAFLILRKK